MIISTADETCLYYKKIKRLKYAEISKSILNYKLNRGMSNSKIAFEEALTLLASSENEIIKKTLGNSLTSQVSNLPKKIFALVHFGRSGSGLLHSLIDAHPEVTTLPSVILASILTGQPGRR